jgi:hypothetical protein
VLEGLAVAEVFALGVVARPASKHVLRLLLQDRRRQSAVASPQRTHLFESQAANTIESRQRLRSSPEPREERITPARRMPTPRASVDLRRFVEPTLEQTLA